MNILVNNKPTETDAVNLKELAAKFNLPMNGVAMALGTTMVQRTEWETTMLKENDSVIIIKAACGG